VIVTFGTGPTYQVTLVESGLPSQANWSANVNGLNTTSNSSQIVMTGLPNGTYSYVVWADNGYRATPSNGTFWILGANRTVSVSFAFVPPTTYPVIFVESGLPSGANWSVKIDGVSKAGGVTPLQFDLAIGLYSYTARSDDSHNCSCSGPLSVSGPTSVQIQFSPDSYELSFHSTGLTAGTGWAVLIGTRSNSSLSSTIGFVVDNGTYGYVILPASGFTAAPPSGVVTVNGTNVSIDVTIHPMLYPVVFVVLGLPNGTNWSVHVTNASLGINETTVSATDAITFFLPNGTYAITFGLPPGYSSSPGSTVITVAGKSPSSVPVQVASTVAVSAGGNGDREWQSILVGAGATAAALGLLGFYLRVRQRRSRP
jgi:hypothetical protein